MDFPKPHPLGTAKERVHRISPRAHGSRRGFLFLILDETGAILGYDQNPATAWSKAAMYLEGVTSGELTNSDGTKGTTAGGTAKRLENHHGKHQKRPPAGE